MSILNVGSLVELVSGSPRLTVEKMEHTTMHCVWFNNGECHREAFDMAVLRKCEDRKPDSGGFGGGRGGDRGGRDGGGRGGFGGGRGGDRGGRDDRRGPPKDRGGFGKKDPTSFRKD